MYRTMICSSRHPPVHRLRALLVRLWTDGILTSREFLPPLTRIGSTLAVQRGTPSVPVELSEHYCSVILDRWEVLTGDRAELVGSLDFADNLS